MKFYQQNKLNVLVVMTLYSPSNDSSSLKRELAIFSSNKQFDIFSFNNLVSYLRTQTDLQLSGLNITKYVIPLDPSFSYFLSIHSIAWLVFLANYSKSIHSIYLYVFRTKLEEYPVEFYAQGNVAASRKQIQPLLTEYFKDK